MGLQFWGGFRDSDSRGAGPDLHQQECEAELYFHSEAHCPGMAWFVPYPPCPKYCNVSNPQPFLTRLHPSVGTFPGLALRAREGDAYSSVFGRACRRLIRNYFDPPIPGAGQFVDHDAITGQEIAIPCPSPGSQDCMCKFCFANLGIMYGDQKDEIFVDLQPYHEIILWVCPASLPLR